MAGWPDDDRNSSIVLILAHYEFGLWALVSGIVSANVFKAVAFNPFSPEHCLPNFSLRGMRSMLSLGASMTLTSILGYLYSQSDILIGGRMLGKELMGIYAVSMQLPMKAMWKNMAVLLTGSLVMGLVAFGLNMLLGHRLPMSAQLTLLVCGGAAAYSLVVFAYNREILKEIKAFALAP